MLEQMEGISSIYLRGKEWKRGRRREMLNVTILRKIFFPLHEKGERREGER